MRRTLAAGLVVLVLAGSSCRDPTVVFIEVRTNVPYADGLATAFTVATAHDQIQHLGGGRDHTVVLLMGIGTLAHAAMTLARGDRGADCPVAIVEDGFGPGQRVTVGTLATIAHQAAARGVRSPAVVVAGDVVSLRPAPAHPEAPRSAPALGGAGVGDAEALQQSEDRKAAPL